MRYLAEKDLEIVLDAQRKSVEQVFLKNKIPFRTFSFSKKNEDEIGTIFTFFVLETILLSKLMKINPFDQPAVESIKKYTKIILSKS